ncbi:YfhO family protein [Sungkyunkwania multivorans]|uniref:YfhO family protein n=1 Tax=Sungkyunkwania multivorans TaxID=1173618 RepID=A0ABW3CZM9_9FLAO
MKFSIKKWVPHLLVVLSFVIIAIAYFHPVLQGKKLEQSDITQFKGASRSVVEFREEHGEEPYWADNLFGGMPAYQVSALYPHNYLRDINSSLRVIPAPASAVFLYFIGFYVLLLVLKIDYKLAFLGALAFGLSTYMIIILGVGHNSKANAIGYMPFILSGIFLVFQRKYLLGFALTTLFMGLEISANHYQMTYYLFFLVLAIGGVFLYHAYKDGELKHFFTSVSVLLVAVILSIGMNATPIMATQEYVKESIRGKNELTINPDGSSKEAASALSKDYITDYSYGILESFDLFIPRLMGGSNGERLGKNSNSYEYLLSIGARPSQAADIVERLPMYWGNQPIVAAPAYLGAVVIFLFVMALFLVKGKLKWSLLIGGIFMLLLSYGKNFSLLTNFMIDHFPLYDKFRAVSSAQVIVELVVPILAILGLRKFFAEETTAVQRQRSLKWSLIITGGIAVAFILLKGSFDYTGVNDDYYANVFGQIYGPGFMDNLIADRELILFKDAMRSLLFVGFTAAALWLFTLQRLKKTPVLVALGVLLVVDLVGVGKRYVNADSFVSERKYEQPFKMTQADREILKDKGHYRVYEPSGGLGSSRTSYFHNAVLGYHAAKLRRFQDLYEFHISQNNIQVLNMLNAKYIIRQGENGNEVALTNPYAFGNAWFIDTLKVVQGPNEAILALKDVNLRQNAVMEEDFANLVAKRTFTNDSTDVIILENHRSDHQTFKSSRKTDGFAVFSEIYYEDGWNAYIDGVKVPHYMANYVLRALPVPSGNHTIEFRFEPEVIKKGTTITLASYGLAFLLLLGGFIWNRKRTKNTEENIESGS